MADLITVEEYKDYKGITKTDQDSKLDVLVPTVSALIKAYLGQDLTSHYVTPLVKDYTIPYDTNILYLDEYPINEVILVEEAEGGWVGGLDSTIHYPIIFNTDYTFSSSDGALVRTGSTWANSVRVTYTFGYPTTPYDVKFAAIELVSYYLNEEWKPARQAGGTSISGPAVEAGGMPKHIKLMLDNYKQGL